MRERLARHIAIAASAGCGKTYRLAHRYIGLLACGVEPDRICALTFSRKSAGEIFESIVQDLVQGAATEAAAARHSNDLDPQPAAPLGPVDFAGLLRRFLGHLHRLHIGTIDSFNVGVVRAFPLELGIPAVLTLMEGGNAKARERRLRLLDGLFEPGQAQHTEQSAFLEAYREVTFGSEEKTLLEPLNELIAGLQRLYRRYPEAAMWGSQERIFGASWDWHRLKSGEAETMTKDAESFAARIQIPDLGEVIGFLAGYSEATGWDAQLARKALFGRVLGLLINPALEPELKLGRKTHHLSQQDADLLRKTARHLVAVELDQALRKTAALHRVLDWHEQHYDAAMRSEGWLTFDDIGHLLAGGAGGQGWLSQDVVGADRLFVQYRLDCKLDHWLLDEFQDTSDTQWAALSGLVDEVVQDSEGTRSLFYVGDVKQAIYGWRGGNHRLFGSVLDQYGGAITAAHLDRSQRSVQPIIDTVNRVFEDLTAIELPEKAVQEWKAIWKPHQTARNGSGYAALIEVQPAQAEGPSPMEDAAEFIAAEVRRGKFLQRGLECAVLVRNNAELGQCAHALRLKLDGVPICQEGKSSILDAPAVSLLLDLLRHAAHPGDSLARQHVRMSPLGRSSELEARLAPTAILAQIETGGVRSTLAAWREHLAAESVRVTGSGLTRFEAQRVEQLLDLAADFDAIGDKDLDAFCRLAEDFSTPAAGGKGGLRVMTIHQSKGLGFDVVFVPSFRGLNSLNHPRPPAFLVEPEAGWLLAAPRRCILEIVPQLSKQVEVHRADATFGELCVLYVALTRAKRALYMVVPPPPKSGEAVYPSTLLRARLAPTPTAPGSSQHSTVLYETGQKDWFQECAQIEPVLQASPVTKPFLPGPAGLRLREPSHHEAGAVPIRWLLDPTRREVTQFGTALHALFEKVEWIEDLDAEAVMSRWREQVVAGRDVIRDVETQFRTCLAQPDVRRLLARPPEPWRLWREMSFEVVVGGTVVSGKFDRVMMTLDAAGVPASAMLLDYKSDRVDTATEIQVAAGKYRGQMADYRDAVARLTGLPAGRIAARLLFTRPGVVEDL